MISYLPHRYPSLLLLAGSALLSTCATPAQAQNAKSRVFDGNVEKMSCDGIFGWAWEPRQPNTPIQLDIYDGNRRLARVTANVFRQDLAKAGRGNGKHGFAYPLPAGLKNGRPHSMRVKVAGTNVVLRGSSKSITCMPPRVFDGNVEKVGCSGVFGWVWDPRQPNTPVKVDIYDGNRRLARVTANVFRPDLVKVGRGNGKHGFVYPLPASLKNRRPHSLRVKVAGTNVTLPGSPKLIACGTR